METGKSYLNLPATNYRNVPNEPSYGKYSNEVILKGLSQLIF